MVVSDRTGRNTRLDHRQTHTMILFRLICLNIHKKEVQLHYVFIIPMTIFIPLLVYHQNALVYNNTDNIKNHTVQDEVFFKFFAHRKCH